MRANLLLAFKKTRPQASTRTSTAKPPNKPIRQPLRFRCSQNRYPNNSRLANPAGPTRTLADVHVESPVSRAAGALAHNRKIKCLTGLGISVATVEHRCGAGALGVVSRTQVSRPEYLGDLIVRLMASQHSLRIGELRSINCILTLDRPA